MSSPASWRTNADGSLVCDHRDMSVCRECAQHPLVLDCMGAHYLDHDGRLAAMLAEDAAAEAEEERRQEHLQAEHDRRIAAG
jgi:hypothetical protein